MCSGAMNQVGKVCHRNISGDRTTVFELSMNAPRQPRSPSDLRRPQTIVVNRGVKGASESVRNIVTQPPRVKNNLRSIKSSRRLMAILKLSIFFGTHSSDDRRFPSHVGLGDRLVLVGNHPGLSLVCARFSYSFW